MIALSTTSERSDDIPVLIYWLTQLDIAKIMDEALPKPHGNRQGLSYGQLSVLLLCYIMSQSDHRLCAVETWAKQHRQTLMQATGWLIADHDLSDDRLGALVEVLGENCESREAIEIGIAQGMIHAYAMPTDVARCDTTSFSVYHQVDKEKESESILRFGHSKDKRPDLRQYRQMLGTLDPAGIPLISTTLPGNGADDPIYVSAWQRLAEAIGHKDFIYLADCKAASHENRARIAQQGGYYCFPLPKTGHVPALLESWVLNPPAVWQDVYLPEQDLEEEAIGVGFEMELGKLWQNPETQSPHHWLERYLVMRSDVLAEKQKKTLNRHLEQAEKALEKLASKPLEDCCELQNKAQAILKRYQVPKFFSLSFSSQKVTRQPRRGRPNPNDPSSIIEEEFFSLQFERLDEAIEKARKLAGWRIYVTNTSLEQLSFAQAMAYYREQWQLERSFHRYKRGQLPALPIFLQNEDRIVGLMFLLTIALKGFTLMEFQVRRQLQNDKQEIAGLYAGNPKRSTQRPSAELLLHAFCNITLYHHRDGTIEISPLNDLQRQILKLMDIPLSIYDLSLHRPLIPILA